MTWQAGLVSTLEVADIPVNCRLRVQCGELDLLLDIKQDDDGEWYAEVQQLSASAPTA